jgi:hypothetical protein
MNREKLVDIMTIEINNDIGYLKKKHKAQDWKFGLFNK